MREKAVITAAITGSIHTPTMSPYLPITPKQIADEAVRAYEAGAAVCHIHARNPETGMPVPDLELIKEIITDIKSRCDIVICITTGGGLGMTVEQRVAPVTIYKPELASFNAGSINFALFPVIPRYKEWKFPWEPQYLAMSEDFIFPNTFKTMREYCKHFADNGTKPEFEIYDAGMVNNVAFLIQAGYVKKPVYIQFVMGVLGGITPSPENLLFLVDYAKRLIGDFEFSVCVAGRAQFPICTQSLLLGGNVRVGLEDNLYLDKGNMAKSNAEQVAKIARIARELGVEPATPNEARQILGLKGIDKVNY
ncbi:MAG TPA: 3-keto-5-aminohexanoate cleavage protein [Syntrophales bacterium]|nr:3-keto-5-aminohexanoate cleavage protein [Syntrophales bacterium]HOM08084.1 3-keto-5-aminohexanoate cleavage protein [Syntrophales bacterium]HOO00814.1 3-keto-5-aminohexanoate cleavage protein [Syntrophales bacterium]HPC01974.1 3-keto-5-aminohexanoate cleavage protein [Syntrophales bacterium]HPQ07496.1 3-keto-5-aminohexanoate cleavage protein [Syntrophales bacterium]